ncbi:MAG: omptin family outer membrane protease [Lachnospiraceae bacterium]|nr:omptin family outer membrane protease [Lachnospiraceae bacterium]
MAAEKQIPQASNETSSEQIISDENQDSANEIPQDENSAKENSSSSEKSVPAEIAKKENPQKTQGWSFGIEPIFGIRFGKEGEIVWAKNSRNGKRYKLSELEWEYTPAWYLGGKIFANYKRFEVTSISKFFMPTHCGTIKDSDWLQDAYYGTGNTSIKTNYSESENHINTAFDLELSFAFKFYPTHFLTLRPKISASYQRMKFSAVGGTLWYGRDVNAVPFNQDGYKGAYYSWDSGEGKASIAKINDGTTAIKYDTRNIYLWTGVQADFIPTKKIVLSLALEVAPLVYMLSYDSHILTKSDYKQHSISAFLAMRPSFNAVFSFNDFISVALNFNGVFTRETEGPNFIKENTMSYTKIANNAGGYSMYFDAGISIRFSL